MLFQVKPELIGRKPKSHRVMSDGLVLNDYTLARDETSNSLDGALDRSRSISPVIGRSIDLTRSRTRSPSPARRSPPLSQSADFERAGSPSRYLYNDSDDEYRDSGEFLSRGLRQIVREMKRRDEVGTISLPSSSHHRCPTLVV